MSNERVYRFEDVIGNFNTVSVIKSCVSNGSFPNFTIMSGDSGTGKSTCAEIVSLALNCENLVDSSPCLKCPSCKANLLSLQGKGYSTKVKKVNMADSEIKKDISNIITQIFKLDVSSGNSVFILEEVHSLNEAIQTSLLEEIDKLGDNVYVILCTTKPNRLLEELRNRSITFRFSKLRSSESRILLEKLLSRYHVMLPSNVKDEILKYSKGVPRVIVKLTDLVIKNNFTYDTVADLLGVIKPREFNIMLKSCSDFSSYLNCINEMLMDYSLDNIIYNFKKYLMDLHFLSAGVSTFYSNTTQNDKELALEIGKSTLYKIQNLVYSANLEQDCDFVYMMLKVRSLVLTSNSNDKNNRGSSSNVMQPSTMQTGITSATQPITMQTGITNATTGVSSAMKPSTTTLVPSENRISHSNRDLMKTSSIYKSPQEVSSNAMKKSEFLESANKGSGLTKLSLGRLKEFGE